jgi:hypothetical protein
VREDRGRGVLYATLRAPQHRREIVSLLLARGAVPDPLAFRLARREPQLLRLLAEACLKSPDAAALLRQEDCSGRRPLDYFLCAQHALDQDRALPPPPLLLRCARLAPGGKYSLGLARDCRGTVCGSTRSTVSC